MTPASDAHPTRRLVRARSGDYVAELRQFYLTLRPYRGRSHRALVSVAWGRLYDFLIAEKVGAERKAKAKRRKR